MSARAYILLRVRLVFIISVLAAGVIVYKLFHIQHIMGDKWREQSVRLHEKSQSLSAKRGNIWTEDGDLLATSLTFYRLALDPLLPPREVMETHLDAFTRRLSGYFGGESSLYKGRILSARAAGKRYVLLSRRLLSHTDKKHLSSWPFFSLGQAVSGAIFEQVNKRFLPFSPIAARTIGNTNWEGRGVVGLEYSFDDLLSGKEGHVLVRRVAGGWAPVYDGSERFPENGKDLVVSLDMEMQDIVQSELVKGVIQHRALHGSVLLVEVATGAIKAIANLSYHADDGQYYEDYNYAVGASGCVEPGSTFKLVTMLSLLEKSSVQLTDSVDTEGGSYRIRSAVMRDAKKGGFGVITVRDVFEQSSNIGMAKLAMQYFQGRPHYFTDYIRLLGLDRPLGFQIKGTGSPYVKFADDPSWSGTSLAWMAHGYELKITPLQLLLVYSAVANGGRMMAPYLVTGWREEGAWVHTHSPRVLVESIASTESIKKMRLLLEGVVERGTAKGIRGSVYGIAGKTGTAKKHKNGRYVNDYYSSFVGYFPKENPKYSCIVVIDEPKNGPIYGGDVAAPIFRSIADRICVLDATINPDFTISHPSHSQSLLRSSVGFAPALRLLCEQIGVSCAGEETEGWGRMYRDGDTMKWEPRTFQHRKVPNVKGMYLRDALFVLENVNMRVTQKGRGRVVAQSPSPGTDYTRGQRIFLSLHSKRP